VDKNIKIMKFIFWGGNKIMSKKTVKDIDVKGKKVLVRCDFNVPYDENRKITDNRRIVAALPTINYLLENDCKVILCSHLGRPKGEVKPEYSMNIVAEELSRLLGKEVKLAKDVVGTDAKNLAENLQAGEVMLLENVRYEAGEEKNDENLSKEFAALAEIFVNDAFGTAHRAHSSTTGVASYLPAVSGFLIEKELNFMGTALENPERPFMAILGGKKVSDKIGVIRALLEKVDVLMIGGAMAYTFFKSMGYEVGNSICELDKLDLARELMEEAKAKGVKLMLPVDTKVGKEFDPNTESKVVKYTEIPDGWEGYDIGTETIEIYSKELQNAKTVIWNGPLGLFEFDQFAVGTNSIAKVLAEVNAIKIIGGGDSAAAIEKAGLAEKFTHISTGGGASLEFLEGKKLPGIEALQDK
jgi:3-phosphoglycerate kinase